MELMKPFIIDQYALWLENIMGTYCICLIRLKLLSLFLYIQKKSDLSSLKKGITEVIPSAMCWNQQEKGKREKLLCQLSDLSLVSIMAELTCTAMYPWQNHVVILLPSPGDWLVSIEGNMLGLGL